MAGVLALSERLTLEVVLAPAIGIAAVARLSGRLRGPDIHDRELDLIIAAGALVTVVALVVGQLVAGRDLAVLAVAAGLVAVLAATVGTRRLWHARLVPLIAALGWLLPWTGPLPVRVAAVCLVAVVTLAAVTRR